MQRYGSDNRFEVSALVYVPLVLVSESFARLGCSAIPEQEKKNHFAEICSRLYEVRITYSSQHSTLSVDAHQPCMSCLNFNLTVPDDRSTGSNIPHLREFTCPRTL